LEEEKAIAKEPFSWGGGKKETGKRWDPCKTPRKGKRQVWGLASAFLSDPFTQKGGLRGVFWGNLGECEPDQKLTPADVPPIVGTKGGELRGPDQDIVAPPVQSGVEVHRTGTGRKETRYKNLWGREPCIGWKSREKRNRESTVQIPNWKQKQEAPTAGQGLDPTSIGSPGQRAPKGLRRGLPFQEISLSRDRLLTRKEPFKGGIMEGSS